MEFDNKRIALLGYGISNKALLDYLKQFNCSIDVYDKKKIEIEIEDERICFYKFDDIKDVKYDIIFRTPGIRPDIDFIKNQVERGAVLSSEMELFFESCPCKIIAVTGSDGKTTTTTIISKMLEEANYRVHIGGNIGTPLINQLDKIKTNDMVVLELSSFQLMTMKYSPNVAVITNISPNHLDYHIDYDEYIEAKKQLFLHQKSNDKLVLNSNCVVSRNFKKDSKSNVSFFDDEKFIYLKDKYIMEGDIRLINIDEIKIPGRHNVENYMAAYLAVKEYIKLNHFIKVAKTFGGVEHRIEYFGTFKGMKFYNDSIASSPNRTMTGILVFNKKVILIAGGKDKGISYDPIGKSIHENAKSLILLGQTANQIKKSVRNVDDGIDIFEVSTLDEAILKAFEIGEEGDIVFFSPASTSFDMFENFAQRGRIFKELTIKYAEGL